MNWKSDITNLWNATKGVVADKQTMLEEILEPKKIISDKDIEINKLKAKNKELSTRLKNKGK